MNDPSMNGANTPATAASPAPTPKAIAEMRWMSMPIASASSRCAMIARVCRPSRVR